MQGGRGLLWHGPSREQGACLKLLLQRFTPTACSPAEQVLASWQPSPRACRNRLHCRALAQQRRGTAPLTRALGVCTPRHWHLQNTPRTEPSSESKVERGDARIAGCTWKVMDTRENRGEDNPKSPVHAQGGQPAGPRVRAVSVLSQTQPPQHLPSQLSPQPRSRYLFPDTKPPEELLLQTASSPWVLGRAWGYASTEQTQLLLPPQPQPGLLHALPISKPGAAKAARNMGAGCELPSKTVCFFFFFLIRSGFQLKSKQALPPGCSLQKPRLVLPFWSHPTSQKSFEGETPARSLLE